MTFDDLALHYTSLACTPGWWQYAQGRVSELEQDYPGLRDAVKAGIKARGYRPTAYELAPIERDIEPLRPVQRRWYKSTTPTEKT